MPPKPPRSGRIIIRPRSPSPLDGRSRGSWREKARCDTLVARDDEPDGRQLEVAARRLDLDDARPLLEHVPERRRAARVVAGGEQRT